MKQCCEDGGLIGGEQGSEKQVVKVSMVYKDARHLDVEDCEVQVRKAETRSKEREGGGLMAVATKCKTKC